MKTAVCLLVRNEKDEIAGWVRHHQRIGFDTVLVYDNLSDDGTDQVVQQLGAGIELRTWPGGRGTQHECYLQAMREFGHAFDWMAVLDADEYLVLHRHATVAELCRSVPDAADAIVVNWAMFGSSGHEHRPAAPVTEAYTRRAPAAFEPNRNVKSLVRPGRVTGSPNPHVFDVPGMTVYPDGTTALWAYADGFLVRGVSARPADYSIAQVNHYFTRSRAHWQARLQRGNFYATRSWAEFDENDRNEVEDRSALRSPPSPAPPAAITTAPTGPA